MYAVRRWSVRHARALEILYNGLERALLLEPVIRRIGPCGGVRANGHCEVNPEMKCVWVEAWAGSRRMKNGADIHKVDVPVDRTLEGQSSWLRVVRLKSECSEAGAT